MFKKFEREGKRIGEQVKRETARVENDAKIAIAAVKEAHHPAPAPEAEPANNDANQNQGNRPGF